MPKTKEQISFENSDSSQRKTHLGVDFIVWKNADAWLWLLVVPDSDGGTIGSSANEAQAMHDARLSIEEKLRFL
jgi:hypothetical protein